VRYTRVIVKPTRESVLGQFADSAIAWEPVVITGRPRVHDLGVDVHSGQWREGGSWEEGLRITFNVEKRRTEDTERAEVNIYNLGDHAKLIIQPDTEIEVISGYVNYHRTIFFGKVTEAHTSREDGDLRTKIQARGLKFDLNIPAPPMTMGKTPVRDKVNDWLKGFPDMPQFDNYPGIQLEPIWVGVSKEDTAFGLNSRNGGTNVYDKRLIPTGLTYTQALEQFTEFTGVSFQVLNRRIYFFNQGFALPPAVKLNHLTGLISLFRAPKKDRETGDNLDLWDGKSILLPDVIPDGAIIAEPAIGGGEKTFVIREVTYKSMGDVHVCEFKCIPDEGFEIVSGEVIS